jgi:hypothetical protein
VKLTQLNMKKCQDHSTAEQDNKLWSSRIMKRSPSLVWEGVAGVGSDQIWLRTSPSSSISVTNTSISVNNSAASAGKKSAAETPMNSLECWDYSVELECLQGPDGKKNIFYPRVHEVYSRVYILLCCCGAWGALNQTWLYSS